MPTPTARLRCEALEDRLTPAAAFSAAAAFPGYAGPVTVVDTGTNLVTTALVGGHVKVFDGTGAEVRSFLAYPGSAGAVQVVEGDFDRSGTLGVATVAATGRHVKVFDGATGEERQSFLAYPGYDGPVSLSAAQPTTDRSTGLIQPQMLVTAAAANGHVKLFDPRTGAQTGSFLAFPEATAPIRAAAADLNADGVPDVIAGAGTSVRAIDGRTGADLQSFDAYPGYAGPIEVSVGGYGPNPGPAIQTVAANGHVKWFDARTGRMLSSEIDVYKSESGVDPNATVFIGGSFLPDPLPNIPVQRA